MVIIEDTRNQVGKHQDLNRQLAEMGHKVIRSKLLVGDYTKAKDQSVCIDTKQNFREVFGNICGKQHARFREECIRAKSAEISLIILIEEETPILKWQSPSNRRKSSQEQTDGAILLKAMTTMHEKYGVKFKQCSKNDTARIIVDLLGG